MKRSTVRLVALALATVMVAGFLTPHFVFAQDGGTTTAQLQEAIGVAASGRAYASGLLASARGLGLDVSSQESLIASGNASLAAAQAALSADTDLNVGGQDALSAMKDYSSASASLSTLLDAGAATYVEVQSASDAIASAGATEARLSTIVAYACASGSVDFANASAAARDCAAANSYLSVATAALANASATLSASVSGNTTGGVAVAAGLVTQARGYLNQTATEVAQLSAYTYGARGEAYVTGPMAAQMAAANASVAAQTSLSAQFSALESAFENSSASVNGGVSSLTESASAAAAAQASVGVSALGGDITGQEETLATIGSDLIQLQAQMPTSLPAGVTAALDADISAAQTSLDGYDSALTTSGGQATAFSQVAVNGFGAYESDFQSSETATVSSGQTFLSSYSALESELSLVAGEFPLLTILATWSATLETQGQAASSGSAGVDTSLQDTSSQLSSLRADLDALVASVGAASSEVEVSVGLVQNATALSVAESGWLNATGAASTAMAASSLQSMSDMAVGFDASAQALLAAKLGGLAADSQALASAGTSLESQGFSTATAMASAGSAISADLQLRTSALTIADSAIGAALSDLGGQEVSAGAALMVQASAELQIAYARPG